MFQHVRNDCLLFARTKPPPPPSSVLIKKKSRTVPKWQQNLFRKLSIVSLWESNVVLKLLSLTSWFWGRYPSAIVRPSTPSSTENDLPHNFVKLFQQLVHNLVIVFCFLTCRQIKWYGHGCLRCQRSNRFRNSLLLMSGNSCTVFPPEDNVTLRCLWNATSLLCVCYHIESLAEVCVARARLFPSHLPSPAERHSSTIDHHGPIGRRLTPSLHQWKFRLGVTRSRECTELCVKESQSGAGWGVEASKSYVCKHNTGYICTLIRKYSCDIGCHRLKTKICDCEDNCYGG